MQRATAADELQAYQMAPYVEAVLRQPTTTPACRYAARLLRARHERTRSRTRARSLLAYESLLDALRRTTNNNTQLSATSRLLYALATPLPLHTQLRKEAAEEMVACGLVGQAITEYEALQAWDALVACYRLLGKTQAAEQLVQERLQVEPTRASLWCTLGDLRLDDAHYHHALEVSNGRSVRAMRSLARSAMNRKEFDQAAVHWEAALAFNPLHEQGWFALGYCCLKHGDHTRALQAFTRCVLPLLYLMLSYHTIPTHHPSGTQCCPTGPRECRGMEQYCSSTHAARQPRTSIRSTDRGTQAHP